MNIYLAHTSLDSDLNLPSVFLKTAHVHIPLKMLNKEYPRRRCLSTDDMQEKEQKLV